MDLALIKTMDLFSLFHSLSFSKHFPIFKASNIMIKLVILHSKFLKPGKISIKKINKKSFLPNSHQLRFYDVSKFLVEKNIKSNRPYVSLPIIEIEFRNTIKDGKKLHMFSVKHSFFFH